MKNRYRNLFLLFGILAIVIMLCTMDMDYSDKENITPRFFRAVLRDGVLEVPPMYSEEVKA